MSDSELEQQLRQFPHRRWNPLLGEWVLVSPHRTQRPWQGQTETPATPAALQYDPTCYLCPGNGRAGGEHTPEYESTYVFTNDYAALKPDVPPFRYDEAGAGLLCAEAEGGECKVICFSPRHDLTLARMTVPDIRKVVDVWVEQLAELGSRNEIQYVQIFENRGAMMGASNPHPHGQIWATQHVPDGPAKETEQQQAYFASKGKRLLSEYRDIEARLAERIVVQNETWMVLVPYWAVWPFETFVLPKADIAGLDQLDDEQRSGLADILQKLTALYDRVFDVSFPYSMGIHGRPTDGDAHESWLLHLHFYPPLLRSATVRKFMVGFELLGSPQRDITPESAAETLRAALVKG